MRLNSSGRMTCPLASASPGMPISSRKSRNAASFSGSGASCTRYMQACCRASSSSAAATLARIMNSSISRWLSSRVRGTTAIGRPLAVEHDPVLGQVQLQRAARPPGPVESGKRAIQRGQPLGRERQRPPSAVVGGLHRFVGQPCRRAHDRALEAVPALAALRHRSTDAPRRRGGPRPAAASTDRSTAPRAASARRGPGNTPSCRAAPPRRRARCPA